MAISYHWKYTKMNILNGIVTSVVKDDDTGITNGTLITLEVPAGQDGFLCQITIETLEGSAEMYYAVLKLTPEGEAYSIVSDSLIDGGAYATQLFFSDSTIMLAVQAA
jgi:hypothetical protein